MKLRKLTLSEVVRHTQKKVTKSVGKHKKIPKTQNTTEDVMTSTQEQQNHTER